MLRASLNCLALALATLLPGNAATPDASDSSVARSYAPSASDVGFGSFGERERVPAPVPVRFDGGDRRYSEDQPDTDSQLQTHLVYFVPKDGVDEGLDTDGRIARSVDSLRAWFHREMSKRPRFDRLSAGGYDISFVRGGADTATYDDLDDIVAELKRRGFSNPSKRYLVYAAVNRGMICGEAEYPLVAGGTARYAAVYLNSSSCPGREFGGGTAANAGKTETIATTEWLHTEGIVSTGAPHACHPPVHWHVCTPGLPLVRPDLDPESVDVMYPVVVRPLHEAVLDRDRDDYLDHPWPHLPNLRNSPWLE